MEGVRSGHVGRVGLVSNVQGHGGERQPFHNNRQSF